MADWTEEEKRKIWAKGIECPPNDPNLWRKDQCGAWMYYPNYGAPSLNESKTSFKWQIDHIKPESEGGEDIVSNARPLQWFNNDSRQNGRLKTKITADGAKNVKVEKKPSSD